MKLTRTQKIVLASVSGLLLILGICVPIGVYFHNKNHKNENNETTTISDLTTTPMSTVHQSTTEATVKTTTVGELAKLIIKDLNIVKDTLNKFQDDLDDLIKPNNDKMIENGAKIFREEVDHFKSTTLLYPGL